MLFGRLRCLSPEALDVPILLVRLGEGEGVEHVAGTDD